MTERRLHILLVTTSVLLPGGEDGARAAYAAQMRRVPTHEIVPATSALHFIMFDGLAFLLNTMDALLGRVRTEH